MNKEDRLKAIKEKYGKLKDEGKLNKRNRRTSNPLDAFNFELASQTLKEQMKDGITFIPIDIKSFWSECGVTMDFNHAKDKIRRYFEIVMLKELFPDLMGRVTSIYGTETTEVLRTKFQTGKHFVVESNKDIEEAFLHINVSDYLKLDGGD